jgi:hypothetical protein
MTTSTAWWLGPDFRAFLPYLRVRHKRGLELRPPVDLVGRASGMVVTCVHCGDPIHCFRFRKSAAKRGGETTGPLYLAISCPSSRNSGCGRSKAASDVRLQIENMVGFL